MCVCVCACACACGYVRACVYMCACVRVCTSVIITSELVKEMWVHKSSVQLHGPRVEHTENHPSSLTSQTNSVCIHPLPQYTETNLRHIDDVSRLMQSHGIRDNSLWRS